MSPEQCSSNVVDDSPVSSEERMQAKTYRKHTVVTTTSFEPFIATTAWPALEKIDDDATAARRSRVSSVIQTN